MSHRSSCAIAAAWLLVAGSAHAGGFEKNTPWSGQYAGVGGATASNVEGAQSLAFNPAGLAIRNGTWSKTAGKSPLGLEVSLQFSPTISRYEGPLTSPATTTSEIGFSPIVAALVSYQLFEGLGLGVGGFVAGGSKAKYENVDFSGFNPSFDTLRPEISTDLEILEGSVGLGYQLMEGLRIGGSWRLAWVRAELFSASPVPAPAGAPPGTPPVALISARLTELDDKQYNGFRAGIQYAPKDAPFGVGIAWRSPIKFTAEGDLAGSLEGGVGPNGPSADIPGGAGSASAEFPSQILAGGFFAPIPRMRVIAEYVFTNYEVDRRIDIEGTLQTPAGPAPLPDITLNWHSQHNVRIGAEYLYANGWSARAGYVLTTQVTNGAFARPTLTAPGFAHSAIVGGGTLLADNRLRLDGAFEFSIASGSGTNEYRIPGDFKVLGFVLHLGASYTF